jgi:hypothetical protein
MVALTNALFAFKVLVAVLLVPVAPDKPPVPPSNPTAATPFRTTEDPELTEISSLLVGVLQVTIISPFVSVDSKEELVRVKVPLLTLSTLQTWGTTPPPITTVDGATDSADALSAETHTTENKLATLRIATIFFMILMK